MPLYKVKTATPQGVQHEITIDVPEARYIPMRVREQGLRFISAKPASSSRSLQISFGAARVSMAERNVFTNQLSALLEAGIPIVESLDSLARETTNPILQTALFDIVQRLQSGRPLSESFRAHPRIFDSLYCAFLEVGERSGALDVALADLAVMMEKTDTTAKKLRGAMMYPTMVLIAAGMSLGVIMVFVVPTFEKMFREAKVPLPLPTQIVLGVSRFVTHQWWAVLLLAAGAVYGVQRVLATPTGRFWFDKTILQLPVLGKLARATITARICRTLAVLLDAGMSILEALDLVAIAANNAVYSYRLRQIREKVMNGAPLGRAFKEGRALEPIAQSMLTHGAATGSPPKLLRKAAVFYENEVDVVTVNLPNAMQPLFIIVLGVVIGGTVISLYLPMFSMLTLTR